MDLSPRSARIGCRCHYLTGVLLAGLSACSADAPPPATVPSGVGGGQSQSGTAAAGDPTFTVSELQIATVQPAMPKITAKVEFDTQARYGANDDRPVEPDRIRVDILFRGGDAETPASVGPGRIDELTVDNGAVVLGAAFKGFIGSGINLTPQEFDATYRPSLFDTSGMQLSVEFPQPAPLPVAITRLAGRVPLLVPRKRFSVTMTHAERLLETTWPVAAAGGMYLAAARGMDLANQPALDILCSSDARIINVCRLLDESGRPISGLEGPGPGLKNGGSKFQIPLTSTGGEPPPRFDLQIELVTAFDKVEIPFRLENIPLGKPSTPVEEADAPAQWVASQVASPLKGVRVFGGFVWGPRAKESDGDGELPNVPQEFRLRLVGHEAAAAVECGKLKFDTVRTDRGATVELKASFMQDTLFERLLPVEHAEFLSDHPLDGVWYKLSVGKVDQPVRMFERIEGTVVLVHADSTKAFRIPDPSQQPEGALTNPALDGAGLKCTWRKGEDGAYEFVMDEGNVQAAKAFAAVDELGKYYPLTLEWTADARGLRIQIPDPEAGYRPRRRELEIVVYQNLQESEIPFSFENVPLPATPRAWRAAGAP